MENCARRIQRALAIRNMKQIELSEITGIPKSAISQYCSGAFKPKQNRLFLIAKALDVDEAWLMGLDVPMNRSIDIPEADNISPMPKMREWRVLGATACGTPLHRESDDETVLAPANIDADYVFRCVGDSMIGAHIFDGDIVFVKSNVYVDDGQIAVIRIGDEYTLKRIYRGEDYLELRAENPKYPPQIIRGEQENAEIVGKAVRFLTRAI